MVISDPSGNCKVTFGIPNVLFRQISIAKPLRSKIACLVLLLISQKISLFYCVISNCTLEYDYFDDKKNTALRMCDESTMEMIQQKIDKELKLKNEIASRVQYEVELAGKQKERHAKEVSHAREMSAQSSTNPSVKRKKGQNPETQHRPTKRGRGRGRGGYNGRGSPI